MQELTPENFFLAAPLFAEIPHHRVIAFSVLEGSCPGRVFVDDPGAPRAALISSITEFFIFSGDALNQVFNCAIQEQVIPGLVQQMGSVALSGPTPQWQAAIDRILAGYPGGWAQRAEFEFSEENLAAVNGWRGRIPPGLRVEAYTRETAALFDEIEPFWNGIDPFLEHGFGYSAFRNAELLSHCHTVAVGGGLAEISVETQPACRRQGLAQLVVSAFIEHSLKLGLRPHWTCWRNNLPSVALAQKLGFVHAVDAPVRYVQPGG
jgi:GNAT superfamily N-acetyltransferase